MFPPMPSSHDMRPSRQEHTYSIAHCLAAPLVVTLEDALDFWYVCACRAHSTYWWNRPRRVKRTCSRAPSLTRYLRSVPNHAMEFEWTALVYRYSRDRRKYYCQLFLPGCILRRGHPCGTMKFQSAPSAASFSLPFILHVKERGFRIIHLEAFVSFDSSAIKVAIGISRASL